jgi:protein tyrosine/serine phosphatase
LSAFGSNFLGLVRRFRFVLIGVAAFLFAAAMLAWHMGFIGENFRAITPGRCYRSAQLSESGLRARAASEKLQSVVNLRGFCNSDWHDAELALCRELNVQHFDFKLDPERLPKPEVVRDLIRRFKAGPYPMLLHCRNGADRTSLAAVLYVIVVEGKSIREALAAQLNWHFGHIRSSSSDSPERFFYLYEETAEGLDIADWVEAVYPAHYARLGAYGSHE